MAPSKIPPGSFVEYEADGRRVADGRYRHARFMPRWAARIWLRATDVRVERLQAITKDDVFAEWLRSLGLGAQCSVNLDGGRTHHNSPRECFRLLWDEIYAKRGLGWDSDPWVWVIDFERTEEA